MSTRRARKRGGIPLFALLAWSMAIGAVFDALIAYAVAGPPTFDPRPAYWLGVVYLALAASVLCFSLYFPVVRKIGPGKAAYSSVIVPIIAMALSTAFEDYRWTPAVDRGRGAGARRDAPGARRTAPAAACDEPRRRLSRRPCMTPASTPKPRPAPEHAAFYRKDYRAPDFWVSEVALDLALDPERTVVKAVLKVARNGAHDRPLRLAGDELELVSVAVDGGPARWSMQGDDLVIEIDGDSATVETEVALAPAANSKLMGLYASGGILCTQCESEGFRRITFHPDRPDVLSTYRVRMSADKARFPILLANGNLVASGEGDDGTHWAEWEDPFPKPSYLFALVAGDLAANRDSFTTMSGRDGRPRHLGARGRFAQDRACHGQPQGGDEVGRGGLWPRI